MKKQLGALLICGAMLVSSQALLAQAYRPGPPGPPPGRHQNNGWRGQSWYRSGGRLPPSYRGNRRYWVNDWRGNRLPPPRSGYRWVRSDNGDFLMVAITTGVIASIIAANH